MGDIEEDEKDALEFWLRTEVVASYDELRANPDRAISSEELRARLAELHEKRLGENT